MRNILTFLPVAVLIVCAAATKKMAEAMVIATLLAMALLHGTNFLTGTIDAVYATLSGSSYQFVLLIIIGFGGMIALLQKSGAIQGFRDGLLKIAAGPRRAMVLAWGMALVLFADEYLNALTVSFSFRDLTDRHGIPREHLALQAQSMACCLCVVVPFSSWTAFIVGLTEKHGLGFGDFVGAIPYMFFPLLLMALCLLLALGLFPKVGNLKRAYDRVAAGGPALLEEEKSRALVDLGGPEEGEKSSALNAAVPLAALVGGVLYFGNDMIHGLLLALLTQLVMYVGQRLMTFSEFLDCFFEGAKSMTSLAIVVCLSFMLSQANQDLGMFEILIQAARENLPPVLLPAVAFVMVGLTTFAVGGCWVVMTVAVPVFLPIAMAVGVSATVVTAAIMSGISLGYCLCFYADAVFMTTAGTGVPNMDIIRTVLPYALGLSVLTAAGYLLCGLGVI